MTEDHSSTNRSFHLDNGSGHWVTAPLTSRKNDVDILTMSRFRNGNSHLENCLRNWTGSKLTEGPPIKNWNLASVNWFLETGSISEKRMERLYVVPYIHAVDKVNYLNFSLVGTCGILTLVGYLLQNLVSTNITEWNDKIVVLKKTTLQLYFKTFIE